MFGERAPALTFCLLLQADRSVFMVVWAVLFSEGGAISTMPVERPTISTSSCSHWGQLLSQAPPSQKQLFGVPAHSLARDTILALAVGLALLCTLGHKPLQCQLSWLHLACSAKLCVLEVTL